MEEQPGGGALGQEGRILGHSTRVYWAAWRGRNYMMEESEAAKLGLGVQYKVLKCRPCPEFDPWHRMALGQSPWIPYKDEEGERPAAGSILARQSQALPKARLPS